MNAIKEELTSFDFMLQSPEDSTSRGSHIAVSHPYAWQICQALQKGDFDVPKIIPDYRPPNIIRLGITPLYTRFEDLWWVVNQLQKIVKSKTYLNFDQEKHNVT